MVTAKTKIALAADGRVKGRQIEVKTTKGVVRLRGRHAKAALNKAKEAQSAGLNEYLNEGIYELGDVIEHANKKQIEDAREHALHAIMRLSQAGGLQVPEDIHPEDRKAGS